MPLARARRESLTAIKQVHTAPLGIDTKRFAIDRDRLGNLLSPSMLESTVRRMPRPPDVARLTTLELREIFLVANLFTEDQISGVFTDLDRLVVGGIMPLRPTELPNHK